MKKIIWTIIIILIIIVGFVYIKKSKPVNTSDIKIGAIISQTGIASAFGEMSKDGIEMAVKEINDDGGIKGRKVSVIFEDDHTDPKIALGLYQKFTSVDHVDAIIGSNFDFVTQPVFAVAKDGNTSIISPSNPRISGVFDTNKNSFVMLSDFSKIIYSLQSYLTGSSYKKMAVVHFQSGFGAEIVKTLGEINKTLGKPDVLDESYKQFGNNDFRTVIAKFKQAGVDTVFLDMVGTDPITFVTQSKQLGFKPQFITYDSIQDSLAIKGTDQALFEGMIVLNWNVTSDSFVQKFENMYHTKPRNSVDRAYDAVYVLAQAVSESKTPSEVSSILEKTKFTTPNGIFQFSPEHASQNTPTSIQIIKDGKLVEYK